MSERHVPLLCDVALNHQLPGAAGVSLGWNSLRAGAAEPGPHSLTRVRCGVVSPAGKQGDEGAVCMAVLACLFVRASSNRLATHLHGAGGCVNNAFFPCNQMHTVLL